MALLVSAIIVAAATAADWPQWGRDFTRNAVSPEKGLPDFQFPGIEDGKVVKPAKGIAWQGELGGRTVVHPVVADGIVWVCTNAPRPPEDAKVREKDWDGGVLMCFRESDGKPLWKLRTPRRGGFSDWPGSALGSVPLIEGDRLWYTNNRHEVVCFDISPLKKGAGDPKEAWKIRLAEDLGVFPYLPIMQSGFAASVAGYKDWLYVVTHNGVDEDHITIPKPDAPSLICVEKKTGKLVWKDNSPGKNILQCQISSPLVAEIAGRAQVIVGQGDGWLRSFEAATGKLIWKCDLNQKKSPPYDLTGRSERNYIVATPVLYDNRIYVASGQEVEHFDGPGCLYCIDPTKTGDVSRELDDGPGKGKPNPNSAVIWHTLGPFPDGVPSHDGKREFLPLRGGYLFGRTISSCTVHDGLAYAADVAGYFHCFDAKSGKPQWIHDLKSTVFAAPLWVDGKVLVANDDGDVWIFAHGRTKKQLGKIESNHEIRPGLVFANGTLYVTSGLVIYAIRSPK
jgi:outer membrane protein assembly factor BamB